MIIIAYSAFYASNRAHRGKPDSPEQALLDTALATWAIAGLVLAAGLGVPAASALAG